MPALLDARGRCTSVGRIVVIRPCPDSSSHVFATFQLPHPGLNPLLNFMFYFARITHKGDASQLYEEWGTLSPNSHRVQLALTRESAARVVAAPAARYRLH
jgi:hypothetical protein